MRIAIVLAGVVRTAYAAFADADQDEEGDLDVAVGDDIVHLRSFEPAAARTTWCRRSRSSPRVRSGSTSTPRRQHPGGGRRTPRREPVRRHGGRPGVESLLAAVATLERDHGGTCAQITRS